GLAEKLRATIGKLFETESCYDPALAPAGELVLPHIRVAGDECSAGRFELADGRIDLDVTCNKPSDGLENGIRLRGVYTAASVNLTTETDTAVAGPGMRIQATMSSNSVWL